MGLILFLFLLLPSFSYAKIYISEVAWMGTTESANDEWIELFNSSTSDVPVDGWTLIDGNSLSISLSGTIPSGGYVVLERTDDDSAPGNAFLVYTGALSNSGATLTLKNSEGSSEDIVAGGTDWGNIGGDNDTKKTPQYTDEGWVTAGATPGSGSISVDSEVTKEEEENDISNEGSETTKSTSGYIETSHYKELDIQILAPTKAYVNQRVTLSATSTGRSKVTRDSLYYEWNFGDLYSSNGRSVSHTYIHPGKYKIWLKGSFSKYNDEDSVVIEVLPVAISITRQTDGDILITNSADYETRLDSYYIIGRKKVIFPVYSTLLPEQSVIVPRGRLGIGTNDPVALYDSTGTMVDSLGYGSLVATSYVPANSSQTNQTSTSLSNTEEQVGAEEKEIGKEEGSAVVLTHQQANARESVPSGGSYNFYFIFGLVLLLGLSIVSVLLKTNDKDLN